MSLPDEAYGEDGINWDCPCLDSMRDTPCWEPLKVSLTCVHEFKQARKANAVASGESGSETDEEDAEDDGSESSGNDEREEDEESTAERMAMFVACEDEIAAFQTCMSQNWQAYVDDLDDDDIDPADHSADHPNHPNHPNHDHDTLPSSSPPPSDQDQSPTSS